MLWDALVHDLRVGARAVRRAPGISLAAVAILGVGLALNVATYSAVSAVLLEPFPFRDQRALVLIWEQDLARDEHMHEISYPNFLDWRDWSARTDRFDAMAAMGSSAWGREYLMGADGEPIGGVRRAVSHGFFETLGVTPSLGRDFTEEDDVAGAPRVWIASHRFWESRLGADLDLIGRAFPSADGPPVTLVGVMPTDFDYPSGTDIWVPLGEHLGTIFERRGFSARERRNLGVLFAVGRLKDGTSLDTAERELTALVRRLREEHEGDLRASQSAHLQPIVEDILGDSSRALTLLWGAVGILLLLICANVASLLLVKQFSRLHEHAVRRALGITTARIVRQLLAEATLLALAGSALAYPLAQAAIAIVESLGPENVPRLHEVRLSANVFLFAGLVFIPTVLLVAAGPAVFLARLRYDLRARLTRFRSQLRWSNAFVIAQMAFATLLVLAGALVTRSYFELETSDLGFEPDGVLTFNLALPDSRYATETAKRVFYRELLETVREIPEVELVAGVNPRPFQLGQVGNDWSIYVEGQTEAERSENPRAVGMTVSADYFRTMGITLVEGRAFTETDDERVAPSAVVSESLAARMWPGESAVGKRLCCGATGPDGERWLTVIGVVENTRSRDVHDPRLDLYTHYLQGFSTLSSFVVRAPTGLSPFAPVEAIRARARAVDPAVTVDGITTMDSVMASVFEPWRFNVAAFGSFALVALMLALLGLFSLLGFVVRRGRREIGIRLALGASRGDAVRHVLTQATKLTLWGGLVGLASGLLLNRALQSLLYETTALDLATHLVVTLVIALAGSAAAYVPAREASRIDPAVCLREE